MQRAKDMKVKQSEELLRALKARFEKNMNRHQGLEWAKGQAKLEANTEKTKEQYRELQKPENFDTKTSSWLKTPSEIRKLGGAIFADRRYNHVFVYHNGAESYYGARAFRGSLRV